MSIADDFAAFWQQFPRRIGKLDAMKAYTQARRMASAETILAGVQRYLEHLPEETRFIPYPASWLRAGRYEDEYDAPISKPVQVDWYAECRQIHGGACGLDRLRHHTRKQMDAAKAEAS